MAIDREIFEAEIVEEKPLPEKRIVQIDPNLEIERLKTRREELATVRTKERWNAASAMVVLSSAFISCAHMCNPW